MLIINCKGGYYIVGRTKVSNLLDMNDTRIFIITRELLFVSDAS